jgi:hypothetical protein
LAVRAAYAPSTPVSAGECNVQLLLSVPDPPMWQLAHVDAQDGPKSVARSALTLITLERHPANV